MTDHKPRFPHSFPRVQLTCWGRSQNRGNSFLTFAGSLYYQRYNWKIHRAKHILQEAVLPYFIHLCYSGEPSPMFYYLGALQILCYWVFVEVSLHNDCLNHWPLVSNLTFRTLFLLIRGWHMRLNVRALCLDEQCQSWICLACLDCHQQLIITQKGITLKIPRTLKLYVMPGEMAEQIRVLILQSAWVWPATPQQLTTSYN